jgi:adenine C2-methylase RlmN of 23S rRNA A2503 and tRNA A37
VIPISGRPDAPATPPNHVRDRIERLKRERAEKILAVALTAKVPEQKAKLVKLSAEAGLDEVVVSVDNRPTPLGAYLAAL